MGGLEGILTAFFSIETIVFCIVVYFGVLAFKKIIEKFIAPVIAKIFPDKWEPWWIEFWREWVLPAAPVVIGFLLAVFVTAYPYPEAFSISKSARAFFGLVAGMASGHVYRFFKYYYKKIGPKLPDLLNSINPSKNEGNDIPTIPSPPKLPKE